MCCRVKKLWDKEESLKLYIQQHAHFLFNIEIISLNNANKFCPCSTEKVLCGQKEDWITVWKDYYYVIKVS